MKHVLKELTANSKKINKNSFKSESEPSEDLITHYPVILEIEHEEQEKVLEELEAVVYHNRGNLFLTSIPVENLWKIPRDNRVDDYHISSSLSPSLDVAREVTGVNTVHTSQSTIECLSHPDSPNRVVTGICDVGFDPRHAAFNGNLERWVIYNEYRGMRAVYDGYENIVSNSPATDNVSKTHATHVANILAGHQPHAPYYGVAPIADLVVTTSRLSDVGICSGIEDVIQYAKNSGRPAVVNISAGSYLGPHDGTDLVGRYLSAMSKDAVICFSAGNYGDRPNCQKFDLGPSSQLVGAAWCDTGWSGFNVDGGTDFWSRDNTPFELRLCLWDVETKTILYTSDWFGGDGQDGEFTLEVGDYPWFSDGSVWLAWGKDSYSGRFNIAADYSYTTQARQSAGPWARYVVCYNLRAVNESTHIDVYADGIQSFLHNFSAPFCTMGNADGSVSNLASSPDVVCVGAWTSRSVFPDITSGTYDWGTTVNSIAQWSAWGTTGDGRPLPHISAPGNAVISALSTPHIFYDGPKDDADRIAAEIDGYSYFAAAGTSMSSPFVAGVFALWLNAYPDLSVHDLIEVSRSTANRNFNDIADPRWGAGSIDAYSGLLEVLERKRQNTVISLIPEISIPKVFLVDGSLTVDWPGVERPVVETFDLTGRKLNSPILPRNTFILVSVTDSGSATKYTYKIRTK